MNAAEQNTFETLGRENGSSVIAELVASVFEREQVAASAEELAAWAEGKIFEDEQTFDHLWGEIARVVDLIEDWAIADLDQREC